MNCIKCFIITCCLGLFTASYASAQYTIAEYGPGRSAKFQFIHGTSGGYVTSGVLFEPTPLLYRSGALGILIAADGVVFVGGYLTHGTISGSATVNYNIGTIYAKGVIGFDATSHYPLIATTSGPQNLYYGLGADTVAVAGDEEVHFGPTGMLASTTLSGNQSLYYMISNEETLTVEASFKAGTEISFDSGDNLVLGGTLNGTQTFWYTADDGYFFDLVELADNTEAAFGAYTPFAYGGSLGSGTLSTPQTLAYYADTSSSPFIVRTAYVKGVVGFAGHGLNVAKSASAQALATSTGTYNASDNEILSFVGAFIAP